MYRKATGSTVPLFTVGVHAGALDMAADVARADVARSASAQADFNAGLGRP